MPSSPSLLRAFFTLNKIPIFCISRTASIAADRARKKSEILGRVFSIDCTWGEKTHTGPCMEPALPGSGHCSTSGLEYPAHPGTKQAGAWSGLTQAPLGNHICPSQPLPQHLPCIHQHRERLEKVKHTTMGWLSYSLPRYSRLWAGLVFTSFK